MDGLRIASDSGHDGIRVASAIRGFVVAALLLPSAALAAEWPSELMVNGARIAPTCIDELVTTSDPDGEGVSLTECTAAAAQYEEVKDKAAPAQGFVGWHYRDKDGNERYSYSNYLGRFRGGFVLYSMWNGGGAAEFTDISIIKRKGDKLMLHREVAAGDRCNAGITEAWMERGKLFYKINMTPYDIVAYADSKTALKASDDLVSTPTSCFAVATFTHTHENQPVLQLVTLNQDYAPDMLSDAGWTRDFRYQTCFNKQFLDTVNTGNVSLDKKAIGTWVQGFYEACVSQKAIAETPVTPPVEAAPPLEPAVEVPVHGAMPDDGAEQTDTPEFKGDAQ